MTDLAQKAVIKNGEDEIEVSLAEIAGVDMTGVEEVRFEITPMGKYIWDIKAAEFDMLKDLPVKDAPGETRNVPIVRFELEADNCLALLDDERDPANEIGRKHQQTFFLNDVAKDLGKVKAFLVDIGLEGAGSLQSLLDSAHGMQFVSDIVHAKNKDNPDRPYVNMRNIQTMADYNEEQQDTGASEQEEAPVPTTLNIGGLAK